MDQPSISVYRLFISHRYSRAEEYRRLVRMLDRAQDVDPTWRWENLSIPFDAPIMTAAEATEGETYIARIRQRLDGAHAILYILRDEWIEAESVYLELVETTPPYRPPLPIISVLPHGTDLSSLRYEPPGPVTVGWRAASIVAAVREHAIPADPSELRLTEAEAVERSQIASALEQSSGNLRQTADTLGIGLSTLRRRRMAYLLR